MSKIDSLYSAGQSCYIVVTTFKFQWLTTINVSLSNQTTHHKMAEDSTLDHHSLGPGRWSSHGVLAMWQRERWINCTLALKTPAKEWHTSLLLTCYWPNKSHVHTQLPGRGVGGESKPTVCPRGKAEIKAYATECSPSLLVFNTQILMEYLSLSI